MNKQCSIICFFLLIAGLYGCKSELAKADEQLQQNQETILKILEDNVEDSEKAVSALAKLEEATRDERSKLRKVYDKERSALSKEERDALNKEGNERWNAFSSKLGALIKRYEKDAQPKLKTLIGQMAR